MTIAQNFEALRDQIAEAAGQARRDPAEVQLVAVSKLHSAESIREAYDTGQRHFGENYVQELLAKREALADLEGIQWHFIGHLQRNKAKALLAGPVALVETVDSPRLLAELDRRAQARGVVVEVLLQVKIGGEATKSGCPPEETEALLEAAEAAPALRSRGLMVIPPFELEADQTRAYFRELRELRDQLGGAARLPELSMGMSHDFTVAIEEGATLVRVGTALFGPRRG